MPHISANFAKIRKWVFFLLYICAAKHLPISSYPGGGLGKALRYLCGKNLFRRCGQAVNIEQGADFMFGESIEVGHRSGIGIDSIIRADLVIGSDVMMGPRVIIYGRDHCFELTDRPMATQGMGPYERIVIEDDVWIGAQALILKGVTIGKGAIVAAGAVVTKDIPPYSIVAGNPARIVRSRLTEVHVEDTNSAC